MTEALPFYLGLGADAALCLYHEPPGDAPPGTGVVIVPPFGWDEVASYRVRRAWADELAAAGHPVVRLDLPGTGDAGGGPRDPGRVDAWVRGRRAGRLTRPAGREMDRAPSVEAGHRAPSPVRAPAGHSRYAWR